MPANFFFFGLQSLPNTADPIPFFSASFTNCSFSLISSDMESPTSPFLDWSFFGLSSLGHRSSSSSMSTSFLLRLPDLPLLGPSLELLSPELELPSSLLLWLPLEPLAALSLFSDELLLLLLTLICFLLSFIFFSILMALSTSSLSFFLLSLSFPLTFSVFFTFSFSLPFLALLFFPPSDVFLFPSFTADTLLRPSFSGAAFLPLAGPVLFDRPPDDSTVRSSDTSTLSTISSSTAPDLSIPAIS